MASKQKQPIFKRLTRFLEFLIGIFGALAIIGVFFKIQKWPNYEIYMIVGFMGEAAAFVIMGVFSLMEGFTSDDSEGAVPSAAREGGTGGTAALAQLREASVGEDLQEAMDALGQEVHHFGEEVRAMSTELGEARQAVRGMQAEMQGMADGSLAADATQLGESIRRLGQKMSEMGSSMEAAHRTVQAACDALGRVGGSDLAGDAERLEKGMSLLSEEVHEMGAEMGPARRAVQDMRTELDRVVSGNLAGDAENLGSGMKQLGTEMKEAGTTVERIRADLEYMAMRFQRFNSPAPERENGAEHAYSENSNDGRLP